MGQWRTHLRVRLSTSIVCGAVAAAGLVLAIQPAQADEWPTFRKGLWEFNRTMQGGAGSGMPDKLSNRRCVDPGEEMKRQNAMFAKAGCTLSPVTRKGNLYSFVAECKGGATGKLVSQSVITVESDSAYTVEVESSGEVGPGGGKGSEVLKARRVGDCP